MEILLVEDNPQEAELTIRALKKRTLANHFVHVHDGQEALDFLFAKGRYKDRDVRELPKVVLLDWKLPKLDGIEVLRQLRANKQTRLVPVVILTSNRTRELHDALKRRALFHWIGHPSIEREVEIVIRGHLAARQFVAQERDGVRLQRQLQRLVIIHHVFGERHVGKRHMRLVPLLARVGEGEERERLGLRQRLYLPQRGAPVEAERAKGVSIRKTAQHGRGNATALAHVGDAGEALPAPRNERMRIGLAHAVDLAKTDAERKRAILAPLQRVVVMAVVHVDLADLNAMLLRIAYDLRRRIEPHRLRVQQRTRKRRRMMTLDPR